MSTQLRTGLAAFMILIGAVWMGQGVGWIGGSFMTGDPTWLVIGAVVVLAGIAVIVVSRRRGAPRG